MHKFLNYLCIGTSVNFVYVSKHCFSYIKPVFYDHLFSVNHYKHIQAHAKYKHIDTGKNINWD